LSFFDTTVAEAVIVWRHLVVNCVQWDAVRPERRPGVLVIANTDRVLARYQVGELSSIWTQGTKAVDVANDFYRSLGRLENPPTMRLGLRSDTFRSLSICSRCGGIRLALLSIV